MATSEIPGVYYDEDVLYALTGEGSKIPVIIGVTGNNPTYKFISYNNENKDEELGQGEVILTGVTSGNYSEVEVLTNSTNPTFIGKKYYIQTDANPNADTVYPLYTDAGSTSTGMFVSVEKLYSVDGTQVNKYYNWDEVNLPNTAANPGIGVYTEGTTNQLSKFLYEFYDEARLQFNSDVGVPYIYVIDVGNGEDKQAWLNAIDTAKSKLDAIIEAYIGADNITGYSLKEFIDGAFTLIKAESVELDLRTAFTTKGYLNPDSVTDAELIALTNETTGNRYSRIGIMEPLLAGKTFARICCTPANTEPGFIEYRSVDPETFKDRTKAEMKALQNAGIIFNRDEHINGEVHPKINLCVSTAYAASSVPADALFHARFNADDLLRNVFAACYTQVKANESATNIAYLQTRINKLVNDRVSAEEMKKFDEKTGKGTKLVVQESTDKVYSLYVSGQIHPEKCTQAILVKAKVII